MFTFKQNVVKNFQPFEALSINVTDTPDPMCHWHGNKIQDASVDDIRHDIVGYHLLLKCKHVINVKCYCSDEAKYVC